MYARILIAIDGSQVASRALDRGLELAGRLGSAVTIMHAAEVGERAEDERSAAPSRTPSALAVLVEATHEATDRLLQDALAQADAAGVKAVTAWVENHNPARAIVATAEATGADLIVMGGNGRRGMSRLVLGSQAAGVLQLSKVPVMVIRGDGDA